MIVRRQNAIFGLAALGLLGLAACTTPQKYVAAPTFPTVEEKQEIVEAPPPVALAETGSAQEVWQLRSALNVAALACGRNGGVDIGPRYNAMLRQHQTLLTQAYLAEEARYKAKYGRKWQTIQDREATSLYNRYANHPNPRIYCKEANEISRDAERVESNDFARFAAAALLRLEASPALPPVLTSRN
jgi:hypothetical protein